jgi:hypothetical protein
VTVKTEVLYMTATKGVLGVLGAVVFALAAPAAAQANTTVTHSTFKGLTPKDKVTRQVYVHNAGRISMDVTWTSPAVELTLTLNRPNATAASHISGTGGSLTLSYSVTEQEVSASKAANNITWKVEITRDVTASVPVSGKLSIAYPWEVVALTRSKRFQLAPLGNVPTNQSSHSESFSVLGPGTIRVIASWSPGTIINAILTQNSRVPIVKQNTLGPFQATHHVSEGSLGMPAWSCKFENLSQHAVLGTMSIFFEPDR